MPPSAGSPAARIEHRCRELIYSGFHGHSCQRKGTVQENGEWWCKQHAPSAKKARRAASDARFNAEWDSRQRAHKLQQAKIAIADAAINWMRRQGTQTDVVNAVAEYERLACERSERPRSGQ